FAPGAPRPAPLVYRSGPKLLRVRWRLALFRPAWLLRRPLQWRQLRSLLDANADRTGLELRLIINGRAVLCFLHVRCSADRAGDPIVAEERPDYYAINYPELQARVEIAHRPLIEV